MSDRATPSRQQSPQQSPATPTALKPGDRIPDFLRRDYTGQPQALYEYPKGNLLVLASFARMPEKPDDLEVLKLLEVISQQSGVCCLALIVQEPAAIATLAERLALSFACWSDDGAVTALLHQGTTKSNLRVFVLDANLRVRSLFPNQKVKATPDTLKGAIATALDALTFKEPPRSIQRLAPVLLVPDAFDPQTCQRFVRLHDRGKTFASGMVRTVDGKRQMQQEGDVKRRIDYLVEDPETTQTISNLLVRRVLPEMKKAFHFEPAGMEPFKIARYEGEQSGFFSAHRDNNTTEVARRRFALTLNLNSPATYKGGALRFLEYSADLYRPEQGEALVFSCSHLHEVTPVTSGTRYVLITFFLR